MNRAIQIVKGMLELTCYVLLLFSAGLVNAAEEIEEILVTASKRGAASVQDIPYNISAVSGGLLERTAVDSFAGIARLVPGLEAIDAGPKQTRFIVRGLAGNSGAAQTGVYLDEIPFTFSNINVQQASLTLYDMERVEVLRGPQGTLYGEGSQGGTIRYITRKPNVEEFEGMVDTTVARASRDGGNRFSVNGVVNVPLVKDKLAVRAVIMHRDNEGLADRPDLGLDGSDEENTIGGRIQALWNITDNTDLLFAYHRQDIELDDDTSVGVNDDSVAGFVIEPFDDELEVFNLTFNHKFPLGTFTWASSSVERDDFFSFDVSQFTPVPSRVNQPVNTEVTSHEVRFASDFENRLQLVIGGYYQNLDINRFSFGGFVDTTTGDMPNNFDTTGGFFALRMLVESEIKAIFGEVSFDVTDRFTLLVGGRHFDVSFDEEQFIEVPVDIFGRTEGFLTALSAKSKDEVFKAQVSYELNDDILFYATWAEGFRRGGGNVPFAPDPTIPTQYEPDVVTNWELGWKSTLLNRQLVLNGAIYFMEWDDIQISQPDATGATIFIDNFGAAELYGLEVEGTFQPQALPGLFINFGFNVSNQKLTEDSPQVATGRKGDPIPNTIEESASLGLEQRFPILGLDGFARLDVSYTGKAQTAFSETDRAFREWGDYVLTNIRVGVDTKRWAASIFANNLFDERKALSWNVQERPGIDDKIQTTLPRTVGVNFKLRY